jgi:hypothetical protein
MVVRRKISGKYKKRKEKEFKSRNEYSGVGRRKAAAQRTIHDL